MDTIGSAKTLQICIQPKSDATVVRTGSPYHGRQLAFRNIKDAVDYVESHTGEILGWQHPQRRVRITWQVQLCFENGLLWEGEVHTEGLISIDPGPTPLEPTYRCPQYFAEAITREIEFTREYGEGESRDLATQILETCTLEPAFVGADAEDLLSHPDLMPSLSGRGLPILEQCVRERVRSVRMTAF